MAKEESVNIILEVESLDVYESEDEDESNSEDETNISESATEENRDETDSCEKDRESRIEIEVDGIESNDYIISPNSNKQSLGTSSSNRVCFPVHACTYDGCEKAFSRPNLLAQHHRTHTGERPYVCPVAWCPRSYTRQQHLKRHMETGHQEKSEEKLKCDKCEKLFSNVYSLKKHHFRYHVRNRYKCEHCSQTFKKQQHLSTHSFVHTGIKPFKCDFPGCDVRCEAPSRLKRHYKVHEKNRYSCPRESCKEVFDEYKELQHHLSIGHPKECDICKKTFRQLRQLKLHRLTHETVKVAHFCPFETCDKYFYQEKNLNAHFARIHERTKIYECGVCSRQLSSKQKLMYHTKTHSPGYKRNYTSISKKPRRTRKDKGVMRKDINSFLSVYYSDEESKETNDTEDNCSVQESKDFKESYSDEYSQETKNIEDIYSYEDFGEENYLVVRYVDYKSKEEKDLEDNCCNKESIKNKGIRRQDKTKEI
ncbi:transcription factor IIIA-like [Cherax quadricarinatus]